MALALQAAAGQAPLRFRLPRPLAPPRHAGLRCFGDDPGIGLMDGETKSLALHPHRHALHPAICVDIEPRALATDLDL